jgi:oxygen-independent coproporphyrinogen-3 oxidase
VSEDSRTQSEEPRASGGRESAAAGETRIPEAVDVTLELLRRYDRPGPRYTSYPTAVEFTPEYTERDYRNELAAADAHPDEPLSLYVHIPFCEERCLYCGCNVVITKKREVAVSYLESLHHEIDLLAAHLPHRRKLSQYHWGGGTPTYLDPSQIEALQLGITEHFEILPDAEVAIEVDPRVTTFEQTRLLKRLGFNRISMGVQDFTPEVQAAVRRNQTEQQTRRLYDECRRLGFHSINLDLIYGLPLQTPETFERSTQTVIDLRPDRIALYSYAFVPWLKAHQKWIDVEAMPDPATKLRLFCIAREMLLQAGYSQIGMDHFALPEDEMVLAMQDRRLHRNFMGYTVRRGSDMLGLGTSAIGDVQGSLAQNVKKLSTYREALDAGRFPIERGIALDEDDLIRREVITRLMCNLHLDQAEIETRFGIDFASYFARELNELRGPEGPVEHGFLAIGSGQLQVVGRGPLFIRNICMAFDRYLRKDEPGKRVFSRTV